MDASQPRDLAPPVSAGLKGKWRWRLNRLRCMTPQEVVFRAWRAGKAQGERLGWLGRAQPPAPDLSVSGQDFFRKNPEIDPAAYVAAADRIADGWLDVFALKDVDLGTPPRWNRDPKTGIEAPLAFGKLLDYRDTDLVGDIKYLWEPNRHLHLVTLAQAWSLTGEAKYAEALREQLESWFIACPYPLGANWASSLEVAIRLVNWSLAWQLLLPFVQHPSNEGFRDRWLASVWQHATFVRGWFSLHSSANNHLVGEACGLYLAALAWPHWREAKDWRSTAKAILEREALAQNGPDGVNREQAVSYQQFVLDMMLLPYLAGRAAGDAFSPAYAARMEAMLDFVASIMDAGGNVPMIGDADDGYLVRLCGFNKFNPYQSLLATGALLFRRGDFKQKAGRLDDKTRWLLGPAATAQWAALDAQQTRLPPRQQFAEGGYYVLGCEFGGAKEIRVVADAGPLGYRSIAAHGHADALAFTLCAGGRELLVDPGTYAYHTQQRWRSYFRGTAAHNTVRVDGLDQSEQGGNFLWLRKARAGCSLWLSSGQKDCFEGWHDGYMRLEDPVKHRRLLELDKAARTLAVEDTLEMAEAHDVELFFHFSERCEVALEAGVWVATNGPVRLRVVLPEGGEAELCRGSVSPIAGWISRSFDRRVPSPTLVWRARLEGTTQLRTLLEIRR
ncbi:MAG TPA: alginate lyase family protein [Burkholderiales bacterium]|nr:alginate lyase family protein [Burkholderiales bacterium]